MANGIRLMANKQRNMANERPLTPPTDFRKALIGAHPPGPILCYTTNYEHSIRRKRYHMLTFEQKQQIIETFPELTKKSISLKRLNYHFEDSQYDKTIVVQQLHPNGNGYVFVGDGGPYEADERGLANIREATEDELREMINYSIALLSTKDATDDEEAADQVWTSKTGGELKLVQEDDLWNIYHGLNLEDSFESQEAAILYLKEEGFKRN